MNPLERRVQELEQTVKNLQSVTDTAFIGELQRRLAGVNLTIETGASATGTTVSVRNSTDDGSETVAEEYAGVLTLYANGVAIGRIGYYS